MAAQFKRLDIATLVRPYDAVRLAFIGGAKINPAQIEKLFGNKKGKKTNGEMKARLSLVRKDGGTIDGIAHSLWEDNDNYETGDYRDAVEEVISNYSGTKQMISDMVSEQNKYKNY